MGGSSTFGIEQADGSVIYNIYGSSIFHHSILHEYTKGRTVEILDDDCYHATSVADYYSEARFEEEDSVVRGLQRLDGTLEWRQWGDQGVYNFTKTNG
jgi:hypothetical protein